MKTKQFFCAMFIQMICASVMLLSTFTGKAQDVITIQNGANSEFRYLPNNNNTLTSVIQDAQPGDTIILPGVTYTCNGNITLDKPLTIIGTGIHPDSATVAGAGVTKILFNYPYDFFITKDADNSSIIGIEFDDSNNPDVKVTAKSGNDNLNGLTFERCKMPRLFLGSAYNASNDAQNVQIVNCVINNLDMEQATNVSVNNSVIVESVSGIQTVEMHNCIFFNFNQTGTGNTDVSYHNCIFLQNDNNSYILNEPSRFYNCLWVFRSGGYLQQGANVLTLANPMEYDTDDLNTVFMDVPFNAQTAFQTFDIYSDYHFNPSNTNYNDYLTGGDDDGEIGLYGGIESFKWKDGLLPFNPHWVQLTVPSNSMNGVLEGIIIKGSAQQN